MWSTAASRTTSATPAAVYAVWADVAAWPDWDPSLLSATLDGPFAAGTTGTMHPDGAPGPLPFTLTEVLPGRGFTDETPFGDVLLRFVHEVVPDGAGALVTLRVEVEGPGAEDVGRMVTADLPEALGALAAAAEGAVAAS